MLRTGLNPYGLTYHLGLQGRDTPRANPDGAGLEGFIALATELSARTLEIFQPWLAAMSDAELEALRDRLQSLDMQPVVSAGFMVPGPFEGVFRSAQLLRSRLVRTGLTPVLEGSRNAWGAKWQELVASVRTNLAAHAPTAAELGVTLAIENHQDFTSQELVDLAEEAGPAVGICFDTGNTFPVGEAPLDFTRRIAALVRHVHLKDYRVQFTDEGYRLVRCAIGDGAVPFEGIVAILAEHHATLPAVLEPGALEARHVRFLRHEWWQGYPAASASSLAAALAAAQRNRLSADADYRTPWERNEDHQLVDYELQMIRRSAANMRAIGLMNA